MTKEVFLEYIDGLKTRIHGLMRNSTAGKSIVKEFEIFERYIEKPGNKRSEKVETKFNLLKRNVRAFVKASLLPEYIRFFDLFMEDIKRKANKLKLIKSIHVGCVKNKKVSEH